MIRLCVIHKNARGHSHYRSGRPQHGQDAGWSIPLPARTNDHIEARLGAILFADLRELVGARVVECKDPEAIAEIRNLEDDGLLVQVVQKPNP